MPVGWKQVTVGNCTNDEKQYVLLLSMMNFDESSIDTIHRPCPSTCSNRHWTAETSLPMTRSSAP
jgi:hypothetical protein